MRDEISNSFAQKNANEAKLGAYYTDLEHCASISKMLVFEDGKNYCALDPTIGDASALSMVTRNATNKKMFGIELNDATYENLVAAGTCEQVLRGDFMEDVEIAPRAFSMIFANPPYLEDTTGSVTDRLERRIFEKSINYLKYGGIYILVVPKPRFLDVKSGFVRLWMRNFEEISFYKFREKEYTKFHQCVVVGRRKPCGPTPLLQEMEAFVKDIEDNLEELPLEPEERYVVPEAEDIPKFRTKSFDSNIVMNLLEKNGMPEAVLKKTDELVSQKEYAGLDAGRPPIPLKKDSMYLLLTSGYGSGIVGSEEEGNLHLLRGVAKVVETTDVRDDSLDNGDEDDFGKKSDKSKLVVTTHTQVELRILENDGTLTVF